MIFFGMFVLSACFVAYVIVVYPLLLGWRAKHRGRPIRRNPMLKSVTAIIPVRDGAPWIARKLESLLNQDYPGELLEIIVVSDGSGDGTDAIVEQFAVKNVRLLRVPPGGKPAALNAAIPLARNELLLLTDVRQELEPGSVRKLVACFTDFQVGVASGELVIRGGETSAEQNVGLYWRYETWIRHRLAEFDSMLGATGPFYMIRRELAVPMPSETLLDDVYLPMAAFFRGYRLVSEPEARAIDYPTGLKTEFRRKIRTLAGNYQIMRQYPALLSFRNRMWFDYVSLKVGRLLLPYALLAMLVSSILLPSPLNLILLAPQLAVYLLALVDFVVAENSVIKKLSSPARTFLVLMAASACAVSIFFLSPQKLWTPTRTRFATTGTPPGNE